MGSSTTIDRAFFELNSNFGTVNKDATMLMATIKRLEEEHGRLSAIVNSGTQNVRLWSDANSRIPVIEKQLASLDKEYAKAVVSQGAVTNEMYKARGAAVMLEGFLGVNLPRSVNTFIARSDALGGVLNSVFSITAWGAIAVAIWEVGKKLYEFADSAGKATEETQKFNAELAKLGEKGAELRRQGLLIGATGSTKGLMEGAQNIQSTDALRQQMSLLQAARKGLEAQHAKTQEDLMLQMRFGGQPDLAVVREAMHLEEAIAGNKQQIAKLQIEINNLQLEGNNIQKKTGIDLKDEEKKRTDDLLRKEEERYKALEKQLDIKMRMLTQDQQSLLLIEGLMRAELERASVLNRESNEMRSVLFEGVKSPGNLPDFSGKGFIKPDQSGSWESLINPNWATSKDGKAGMGSNIWSSMSSEISNGIVTGFKDGLGMAKSLAQTFINEVIQSAFAGTIGRQLSKSMGNMFGTAGAVPLGAGSLFAAQSSTPSGWSTPYTLPIAKTSFMGLSGSAGAWAQAGLAMGGSLLMSDAWKRGGIGGVLEGMGGGAALGASIGSAIPGLGTAIGAGIGAMVGGIVGLFGGGDRRRERERERRSSLQESRMFTSPDAIDRVESFGSEANIESIVSLTGKELLYSTALEKKILATVNNAILSGGNQLADNIAYVGMVR